MKKNIEQVFRDSLDELKEDAKAVGMNLTSVCKAAGVARATPDRWAQNPPKTIRVLAKMQDTVASRAAEQAASNLAKSWPPRDGEQPSDSADE